MCLNEIYCKGHYQYQGQYQCKCHKPCQCHTKGYGQGHTHMLS